MAIKPTRYQWQAGQTFNFTALGSEPLPVQPIELILYHDTHTLVGCDLRFRVPYSRYERIDREEWFYLSKDKRGQTFGGRLNPKQEVEIVARLDWELARKLNATTPEAAAKILQERSKTNPSDVLVFIGSWFGLTVTQEEELPPELKELGSVKTGYQTEWVKLLSLEPSDDDEDEE